MRGTRFLLLFGCVVLAASSCRTAESYVVVHVAGVADNARTLEVDITLAGVSRHRSLSLDPPPALDTFSVEFARSTRGSVTIAVTAADATGAAVSADHGQVLLAGAAMTDLYLTLASAADLGFDGGSSLCGQPQSACDQHPEYLFCDGFETSSGTSFPGWTGVTLGNFKGGGANADTSVSAAAGPVCAGSKAAFAHAVGIDQQAFVYRTVAAQPNPLHARMFVYLPSGTASGDFFALFGLTSTRSGDNASIAYDPVGHRLVYDRSFATDTPGFDYTLPLDRWVCLETTLGLDANQGSLTILADGVAVAHATGLATTTAGFVVDTLSVGVVSANASADVYVDEVAVATAPIGCGP